jgi:tripartite-type tricarboxylate transporter receptor subunit TctC
VSMEAGGMTDILGRAIGRAFAERNNPPFVVENRPGAAGVAAANVCAKARADGYAICILPRDNISIMPFQEKLPYDPLKDFEPVSNLLFLESVLVVNASLPVSNFKELVEYSKKNPDALNYAAFATSQAIMQWIALQTGAKWTFIPYKGGVSANQAFAAGQVQVMYLSLGAPGTLGQIRAGKAKALAVSSPRQRLLPDVPSLQEVGLPPFNVRTWFGLFAPAGTPKDAVNKLSGEMAAILRNEDFQSKTLQPMGLVPVGSTPEEFARFIAEDRKYGAELAKLLGNRDR